MKKLPHLTKKEHQTFRIHLIYSIIDGLVKGIFILNEFVFIKSLRGSNYLLSILFQFSIVIFILAVLFNEIIKRTRNKKQLIRITGIFTRIPLLLFLIFPPLTGQNPPLWAHLWFLATFFIFYLAQPIILPTLNLFLKQNYRHEHFGRLFSYAQSATKIAMLGATFTFGLMLDHNAGAFRFVYPVVGLASILSFFLISGIPYEAPTIKTQQVSLWKTFTDSGRRMWHILKTNKPYRDLEIGFMLYGFAWMATGAVITIFYDKALHLDYSSVAFYKNAFNVLAILFLPFFGKLIGRIDPRRFGLLTFSFMALYIFFTGATEFFPSHTFLWGLKLYPVLLIAIFFNGLFSGSMPLLWGIGSAYFCPPDQAADYQSVHLTLVGVRALVAPIIGVTFLQLFGFSWTFGIGVIFLVFAILTMLNSLRRHRKPTTPS